jgi:membrane associated rhomboid family serine protease
LTLAPVSVVAVGIIVAALLVAWSRRFIAAGSLVVANIVLFVLTHFGPHERVGVASVPTLHLELVLDASNLDPVTPLGLLQVLTSMFLHADFLHLVGNVIILLAFALPFEERIGPRAFLLVYLLTGLAGTLLQVAVSWGEPLLLLGASGAVFGIIGAFAGAYPNTVVPLPLPLMVMVIFVRMRVWVAGLVFASIEWVYLAFFSGMDNVAHWAHLGGLFAGIFAGSVLVRQTIAHRRSQPVRVDLEALAPFARDPGTNQALAHMRANSDEPAIFQAWLDRFFRSATCPTCSHRVAPRHKGEIVCTQGHKFDVRTDRPKVSAGPAVQG